MRAHALYTVTVRESAAPRTTCTHRHSTAPRVTAQQRTHTRTRIHTRARTISRAWCLCPYSHTRIHTQAPAHARLHVHGVCVRVPSTGTGTAHIMVITLTSAMFVSRATAQSTQPATQELVFDQRGMETSLNSNTQKVEYANLDATAPIACCHSTMLRTSKRR